MIAADPLIGGNHDGDILSQVRDICAAGDPRPLWSVTMLRTLASLTKPALSQAKRMVRYRFGRDILPRVLNRAIATEREKLFAEIRGMDFSIAGSHFAHAFSAKDPLSSVFGRRGGMVRCKKGLAAMSAEKKSAIRAKALAGRRRARAEREAARRAIELRAAGHESPAHQ